MQSLQKRGQVLIIAAIIIAFGIIGLGTVYISTRTPTDEKKVYDLSNEIDFESAQIIDNGIATGTTDEEVENKIKELAINYAKRNRDSDLAIYYGDINSVKVVIIESDEAGKTKFNFGGGSIDAKTLEKRVITEGEISGDDLGGTVEVSFDAGNSANLAGTDEEEYTYEFELKKGQNFFIVVKKETEDERTVGSS
jgi:hypothetical protein